MKLIFYKFLCIRLSNHVQSLLRKIIISSERNPTITQGISAYELHDRMEKSFNSGIMAIKDIDELKEHYEALKSFKVKLANRLDEIRNANT